MDSVPGGEFWGNSTAIHNCRHADADSIPDTDSKYDADSNSNADTNADSDAYTKYGF